ncbi:peptidylprolyl isomerase [Kineosporia succinea]|uniref:peptidylprolyl isomerase n=1 Tax=Kineosporia succinea TaxID=84632 RepID=A0ABT9NV79_9ACTN|nr:peptidylprolyl isomerase [Kineosporia succinea]MDP9824331.1 peptidyl-prolyl cis-trans isomerase B (cyclophilin B) [Kineosporia succinea]
MTPKNRERAYEKRRYEEWQDRLAAKRAQNRKVRQRLAVGGGSVVVVLVIAAAFLLANQGKDDDEASTSAASTPAASASSAVSDAKSTCPTVDVTAPESPKQYDKVPAKSGAEGRTWTVDVKTTCGDITISLDGKAAPQAVASMVQLAKDGFYDGTPCHRLTTAERFEVLQCGDPTGTGTGGPGYTYGPIENAPSKKSGATSRTYEEGTVAMARAGGDAESMGSQFFLVYGDTDIPDDDVGGYTVLGKITKGLDVVKKVAEGGVSDGSQDGTPVSAVSIESTKVSG